MHPVLEFAIMVYSPSLLLASHTGQRVYQRMAAILPQVLHASDIIRRIHMMLFFWSGAYQHLAYRLVGLRFVSTAFEKLHSVRETVYVQHMHLFPLFASLQT